MSEFVRCQRETVPLRFTQMNCVPCDTCFFIPSIAQIACQACEPGFANDQEEANLCFWVRPLELQESLSAETELLSRGIIVLCSTDASFRQSISRDEVPQVFIENSVCLRCCRCVLVATKHTTSAVVKAQFTCVGVCCLVVCRKDCAFERSLVQSWFEVVMCWR